MAGQLLRNSGEFSKEIHGGCYERASNMVCQVHRLKSLEME